MKTHEMVFAGIMFLTAMSLIFALSVFLKWKRKNFEFENEEILPLLARRFSKIPLTVNLIIFGLLLGTLLLCFLPALSVLCLFLFIILIVISIPPGLSSGFLGIVCSIVCIKRKIKGGIKYTFASAISTSISLGFLLLYIYIIC